MQSSWVNNWQAAGTGRTQSDPTRGHKADAADGAGKNYEKSKVLHNKHNPRRDKARRHELKKQSHKGKGKGKLRAKKPARERQIYEPHLHAGWAGLSRGSQTQEVGQME